MLMFCHCEIDPGVAGPAVSTFNFVNRSFLYANDWAALHSYSILLF